jgi:pyruvate dehydrogenase E1 component
LIPNCISYDPTFSYELAVILQEGLHRMYQEQEDVYYYITLLNENYAHPSMPEGVEQDILRGMYLLQKGSASNAPRAQLLGSGAILREVIVAADLLRTDWGVDSDVWSCPSFTELAREGHASTRWNMLHPEMSPRVSHVEKCLKDTRGPVVAATDYIRTFADQIRAFVPRRYVVLGTDGFGRSDTREKLRHFFEVDRYFITIATLKALADEGKIDRTIVSQALAKYGIDPSKPNPVTV